MISAMTTDQILTAWAAYMRAEDLTGRTIIDRLQFIRHMERATGETVLTVKRPHLIAFMGTPGLSNSTRQHYRSTLHTFFDWMQQEEIRADSPASRLPKVKARTTEADPVPVFDIQFILNHGTYRRTKVAICLHYYLGLRVSEIAAVHGRDIDWRNWTLTTVGKGAKRATLPIPDAMRGIAEKMPRDAWWFPNTVANRLYKAGEGHVLGNSIGRTISDALHRAGFKHHAHQLRAATATEMSRAGADAFVVKKSMRHVNMQTTARYRLVTLDEVRAGMNLLPHVYIPTSSGRAA